MVLWCLLKLIYADLWFIVHKIIKIDFLWFMDKNVIKETFVDYGEWRILFCYFLNVKKTFIPIKIKQTQNPNNIFSNWFWKIRGITNEIKDIIVSILRKINSWIIDKRKAADIKFSNAYISFHFKFTIKFSESIK